MNKRKIALVFPSLEIGGVQRLMLQLMKGLLEQNINVDVVLVDSKGLFLKQLPEGVNLVNLNAGRALNSIFPLARYLNKAQPQSVLSAQTHINVLTIFAKIISGWRGRIIVSEHSYMSIAMHNAKRLADQYSSVLARCFYPIADSIICVSFQAATDFIKITRINPKKVSVIYNPVSVDEVRRSLEEFFDFPWFKPHQPPVILAVGRLSKPKDYPTLINAFNLLRKKRLARLMILGEGKERPDLEILANSSPFKGDIQLAGSVSNPFPFMARGSVFVLSSAWEGFPNVLVEALACGATVVSTDCHSGPREILQNGKYGRLVPVGDAQALADAIEQSLDHPFPAEQSIARAREFSVEKAVQQYLKVLLPDFKIDLGSQ